MNQLFLADLAKKTRRGLVARVKAGRSGGGHCYGYDMSRRRARRPDHQREQAEVIRRIYRDYAAGNSPKTMAHALNRRASPARGRHLVAERGPGRRAGRHPLPGALCRGPRLQPPALPQAPGHRQAQLGAES
jgi:hypothetical protein